MKTTGPAGEGARALARRAGDPQAGRLRACRSDAMDGTINRFVHRTVHDMEEDLARCEEWFLAHDRLPCPSVFAWPFGIFDEAAIRAVARHHEYALAAGRAATRKPPAGPYRGSRPARTWTPRRSRRNWTWGRSSSSSRATGK